VSDSESYKSKISDRKCHLSDWNKSRTENTSLCPILSHVNPKSRTENKSLCPILSHISPTHSLVTNFSNSKCNLIFSFLAFYDKRHFPVKISKMLARHHKTFPAVKQPKREIDHSKTAEVNNKCSRISTPFHDFKTWTRTNLPLIFLFESCHWTSRRRVLKIWLYEMSDLYSFQFSQFVLVQFTVHAVNACLQTKRLSGSCSSSASYQCSALRSRPVG
jgi:hypothetical protein